MVEEDSADDAGLLDTADDVACEVEEYGTTVVEVFPLTTVVIDDEDNTDEAGLLDTADDEA